MVISLHTRTIGIPEDVVERRESVAAALQEALVDLVDLSLVAKQAHWHVRGPQFLPVHQQLDGIVDDARVWADLVAERSVTLGVPVDGRASVVSAETGLPDFPTGWVDDDKAVALMAGCVESVIRRIRARVEELGELDPVTQDLEIEILRGLEKHLWMLEAQFPG